MRVLSKEGYMKHSAWMIEFCRELNLIARIEDDTHAIRERWSKHISNHERENKSAKLAAMDIYSKHLRNNAAKLLKGFNNGE